MSARSKGSLVAALVTAPLVAVLIAVLTVWTPPASLADGAQGSAVVATRVSQREAASYCPARMTVADEDKVGDDQFKASEGDLSARVTAAAFGAIGSASLTPLAGGRRTIMTDPDPVDGQKTMAASLDPGTSATAFDSRMLKSQPGTGAAVGMVSWATKGDLRGIQALACPRAAMDADFLLPATGRGATQRLVAYNPSSKATVISLEIQGSHSSGNLSLETGNTMTVAPGGYASYDLSAAAPGQQAIYVRARSSQAPVAMSVSVNVMAGLNPRGSDQATALAAPGHDLVIPGLRGADQATLLLQGSKATAVELSWMDEDGRESLRRVDLQGSRATAVDLGGVPDGKLALQVHADQPVRAVLQVTGQGSQDQSQSDLALIPAGAAAASSALTISQPAQAALTLVNPSTDPIKAELVGFDEKGKKLDERSLTVEPGRAHELSARDLGDQVAAVRLNEDSGHDSSRLIWNARLSVDAVNQAGLAGLAVMAPDGLMPATTLIRSGPDSAVLP
ncbi:DUF5719 family protein [Bifidobacterium kimbladii]|uniref:Organic solvents resistance ABC transporter permease n=1 Tax=Bifidobacterium asteroides TaxID=1684 RepID=A0A0F4KSG2_9BIFI|nr:DUF5719 family protein [Bifidobacterium asteroides]KJY49607.1 Uncharacterized protein JF69_09130 [Bifidobacterium asteroides]